MCRHLLDWRSCWRTDRPAVIMINTCFIRRSGLITARRAHLLCRVAGVERSEPPNHCGLTDARPQPPATGSMTPNDTTRLDRSNDATSKKAVGCDKRADRSLAVCRRRRLLEWRAVSIAFQLLAPAHRVGESARQSFPSSLRSDHDQSPSHLTSPASQ